MANKSTNGAVEETAGKKSKSVVRETTEAILIALFLALFIRTFILQAFKIPSGSMMNTLLIGDHILVSKFAYGIHIPNEIPFTGAKLFPDIVLFQKTPQRGDIIVFKFPRDESRDFIKRVIGVPGDVMEIRNQKIFINNQPLQEDYILHEDPDPDSPLEDIRDNLAPTLIPPRRLIMLGDNRENSQDSRFWGFLDIDKVKGKALIIYWSWDESMHQMPLFGGGVRFDRIGQIIR
ncbi:MAG: signal peptidase I [Nitrospinae bacterium CG11_big_fil_rev_8_21_14_0_20_56_8]|nr:MAG: signal peptidase I [Nitrospinae bacterium CG11_big_fil_rev_8_21_14_0_20_56_8]